MPIAGFEPLHSILQVKRLYSWAINATEGQPNHHVLYYCTSSSVSISLYVCIHG